MTGTTFITVPEVKVMVAVYVPADRPVMFTLTLTVWGSAPPKAGVTVSQNGGGGGTGKLV